MKTKLTIIAGLIDRAACSLAAGRRAHVATDSMTW